MNSAAKSVDVTTHSNGRCFISYRRSQAKEIEKLGRALLFRGIPIWQDLQNLGHEQTEDCIRSVLADPELSNAILWLSPDIKDSPIIQNVEFPQIFKRYEPKNGFSVVPVATGGLIYSDLPKIIGNSIGLHQLDTWNVYKTKKEIADDEDIAEIANRVLKARMREIHKRLPERKPLRIAFHTRTAPPFDLQNALTLDWSACFKGRTADPSDWRSRLIPAVYALADAIESEAPGRMVVAFGSPSLSAALALGSVFLSTRRLGLTWLQHYPPPGGDQEWTLSSSRIDSGFAVAHRSQSTSATDLAVLVCVTADPEYAISKTDALQKKFRIVIKVSRNETFPQTVTNSGEAVDVALKVRKAIQMARTNYPDLQGVHLFLAGPAGLAMLIGQCLNTFGPIQCYEHHSGSSAVGTYVPSVLLSP